MRDDPFRGDVIPSEAASGKGGTGNALAGTALFLFRTMTLALLKYLQSFSEMSVHIGSASLRYPLRIDIGVPIKVAVLLLAVWPLAHTLAIYIAESVLAERARSPTCWPPCPTCETRRSSFSVTEALKKNTRSHSLYEICCDVGSWALQQGAFGVS
jgi:hypothetical protein